MIFEMDCRVVKSKLVITKTSTTIQTKKLYNSHNYEVCRMSRQDFVFNGTIDTSIVNFFKNVIGMRSTPVTYFLKKQNVQLRYTYRVHCLKLMWHLGYNSINVQYFEKSLSTQSYIFFYFLAVKIKMACNNTFLFLRKYTSIPMLLQSFLLTATFMILNFKIFKLSFLFLHELF